MLTANFWKNKALEERKKNKELKQTITKNKRILLSKLKDLEEEVKDLLYMEK